WVPVLGLPLVFAGGSTSSLLGDEKDSRALFRPLAWAMTVIGAIGTFFHLRGLGRQMGGFCNWKYNTVTGPPVPAPVQVALLGLLGVIASMPGSMGETRRLVRWVRLLDALSYVVFAVESGYNHWAGGYFNKIMYVPIVLSPLLALAHLASLTGLRVARAVEGPLSAVATVGGLVGFGFHVFNISR